MLAHTRKTAEELGLSEPQRAALELVLQHLRTGRLPHAPEQHYWPDLVAPAAPDMFNMAVWSSTTPSCGTVACIGGAAALFCGVSFNPTLSQNPELNWLFFPEEHPDDLYFEVNYSAITPAQAAEALENYLATGSPNWDLVLATGGDS